MQYSETDYDFLARMAAAEEGISFYEEHAQTSDDQSPVLCDTVRFLLPKPLKSPGTRTPVLSKHAASAAFRHSAQIRPSASSARTTPQTPRLAGRFEHQAEHHQGLPARNAAEVFDYPGRCLRRPRSELHPLADGGLA
ncbi:hypothetical protein KCP75_05035 [Salmonella enterica subsp. enterica]|nr:hypothetical protein KCP75_05035 [Salmonella enterica subsp. enterica]